MKTISVAVLAGLMVCAAAQPGFARQASVLHSFSQSNDGSYPSAGLVDVNGVLYGTTEGGGDGSFGAYGTVFAVNRMTGAEKVIYSFCNQSNCTDGAFPYAGLVNVKGTLYGTTYGGGADAKDGQLGNGTLFALDPATGMETVLYSFVCRKRCPGGAFPESTLLHVGSKLYGTTTFGGGPEASGSLFEFDLNTGREHGLYSFCSLKNCTDGDTPLSGLIDANGTLYGMTATGGINNRGALFAFDLATRNERVVYSFCSQPNCSDGYDPAAGLINVNGTLFGAAMEGGQNDSGAVFGLDPNTGTETALYPFLCESRKCPQGSAPNGSLIEMNGLLYGTASGGGRRGLGTVFSIDPSSGEEKTLLSFDRADGALPVSGLTSVRDRLYGTTPVGGSNCEQHQRDGCGVVFALKP